MKKLNLLFAGAFAALAIVACSDDEIESGTEYDEAWYAANATISSSDSHFSFMEDGEGVISFKTEGGSVTVNVDCGTEWTAENSASDIFGCNVQGASITVTAEQNLVEEELYGTITLMTAESKIQFATISITQNAYGAPEITVTANEWHVPAVAATAEELTTEIGVEANGEWSVECNAEWLKAEKGGDSVSLTATENETFEERVAEVVLTCTDGINSDSETITVTQDARAYITLSEAELQFARTGSEATVTVDANYDWDCAYESDWFTASKNTDGSLTITVNANETGEVREGTVTVTASDGAANVGEATLAITQEDFEAAALVLEYTINEDGTEIQLPLGEKAYLDDNEYSVVCTVDWGDDGEEQTVNSSWPSHTYSAGTYTVIINGKVELLTSWNTGKNSCIDGVECLTAVKQWGDTGLKSMNCAFEGCTNLASLPDGPGPFSDVTSFYAAFWDCEPLTIVPEDMFSGCTAAENFEWVFSNCTNLTSAPSFKGLSNVTSFYCAFYYCPSLTTIPEDMFSGCTAAENFEWVFTYCYDLTSAPSFKGLSNVTSFYAAFWDCYPIATLPEDMFSDCIAVENFGWAFGDCTALTTIPENLFADCPSVEGFEGVLGGCTSLETVPVGIFDNNKSVTDFSWAFDGCSNLSGESPYTMIDGNNVHLYERENYTEYFTAPTYYSYCFRDCTGLDDYYSIPSSWGGGASTNSITPQSLNATDREGFRPSRLGPQRDAIGPHRDAATPQGPAVRLESLRK